MKNPNLQMMDAAAKDPRSVAAQMRGTGDGRERMLDGEQKKGGVIRRGLGHLAMGTLLAVVGLGLQHGILG